MIIVITGAGKGIGKAIAIALAKEGVNLILIARTQADVDQLVGNRVQSVRRQQGTERHGQGIKGPKAEDRFDGDPESVCIERVKLPHIDQNHLQWQVF